MNILLLKTWLTNIGNGFIDKGARAQLERAFPDANITETSGYSQYIASWRAQGEMAGIGDYLGEFGYRLQQNRVKNSPLPGQMVSCSEFVDADFAVLPGCVLYESGLNPYLPILEDLHDRDIPIIILGGGGGDYDNRTVNFTRKVLSKIEPAGLITRDRTAYEAYKSDVDVVVDGIDCAFFIDWFHDPVDANDTFVASTFDKTSEPSIETDHRVVRPHHNPFGEPLHNWGILSSVKQWREMSSFLDKDGTFISDSLEDYLFIYKNAVETHADRVHACVPSLVYGNEAQFHYDTPRGGLFDRVLDCDISESTVSIDQASLDEKRERQIDELVRIVDKTV